VRTLYGEFIWRADKGQLSKLGDFGSGRFIKTWGRVKACAHRCTAKGELVYTF
jgi:hypothetical protein